MATQGRPPTTAVDLTESLREAPYRFGFYSLLRRFEAIHSDRPRLGESTHPREDAIRLAQDPQLRFAPCTVDAFQSGPVPRISIAALGMLGPNGPMPMHFTQFVRDRALHEQDTTLLGFLDIFHHRILSLFYRAWASAEPTALLDRPDDDAFGRHLGALFGMGLPGLRDRDLMPDNAKLFLAGRLAAPTRNAEGLEACVEAVFGISVHVEPFSGEWIALSEAEQCRLGTNPASATLGQTSIVGSRAWQCHHKFQIELGPLDLAEYESFLPGSDHLDLLKAIVDNYIGGELDWDLRLILARQHIPETRLGQSGALGWTCSLTGSTPEGDMESLVIPSPDSPPPPASAA